MARYDDLNTKTIAYATIFSAWLLVLVIFLVQGLSYYWESAEEARKRDRSEYTTSKRVLEQQRDSLNRYEWVALPVQEVPEGEPVPEPQKRLQISIERAKELILKELSAQQPSSGAGAAQGI